MGGLTAMSGDGGAAAFWCAALLQACVQGAVLILLVAGVCRLVPRMSPKVRCWLWWFACAKLVVSVGFPAGFALPVLPAARDHAPAPVMAARTMPVQPAALPVIAASHSEMPMSPIAHAAVSPVIVANPIPTHVPSAHRLPPLTTIILIAWLVTIGIGGVMQLVRSGVMRYRLRGMQPCRHEDIPAAALEMSRRLGLRRSPLVLVSTGIASPCAHGFWRPAVILPTCFVDHASPDQIRMAIAHEMAHIRRNDLRLAVVPALAQALFLWNPLVWLAVREYDLAREEACDALTLASCDAAPASYGQLLLQLVTRNQGGVLGASAAMASAYPALRRRLARLGDSGRGQTKLVAAAGCAALVLAVTLAFPWRLTEVTRARALPNGPQLSISARYTVIPLGDDQAATFANAINDAGQVVGVRTTEKGTHHMAVLWDQGTMKPLDVMPRYKSNLAYAINNHGDVVLSSYNFEKYHHAYIASAEQKPLPTSPDLPFCHGQAINDSGQVAGYAEAGRWGWWAGRVAHAALWDGAEMQDLGTLGGARSYAYGVNNSGQVVGKAELPRAPSATGKGLFSPSHAFLWQEGEMYDLGTLPGGLNSVAYHINDQGDVVGYSEIGAVHHAFLWRNNEMHDLGTLPGTTDSIARGINAQGQVVGVCTAGPRGEAKRAFLWRDGVMTDLNANLPPNSGWVLEEARAINTQGDIVGRGRYRGRVCAFVLKVGGVSRVV